MATVILFVFGAIVGSFLNVVGLRYRSGMGLGGRSACASCATTLRWWELLPVASFFILRGRCATCSSRISWQYPIVEIWTGILFVSLYQVFGLSIFYLLSTLIFCIYTVITIYDLRHKIIPDPLVFLTILLALIFRYISGGGALDWAIGPALFALFGFGWWVSKGRALGFGDAKLALSVGLFLGGALGLSAIAMAFWIGTVVTLPLVLLKAKNVTIKSEIPFAPFLVAGAWASLLFNLDIFNVLSF